MIAAFFNYFFFSSAVLICGVGDNRFIAFSESISKLKLNFVKTLLTVSISLISIWAIGANFLVPLNLTELFPLVAIVIFLSLSIFFETMVRITTDEESSDFSISFLIVLFALIEGVSLPQILIIALAALLSFIVLILVVHTFNRNLRIINFKTRVDKRALIFILLAALITVITLMRTNNWFTAVSSMAA